MYHGEARLHLGWDSPFRRLLTRESSLGNSGLAARVATAMRVSIRTDWNVGAYGGPVIHHRPPAIRVVFVGSRNLRPRRPLPGPRWPSGLSMDLPATRARSARATRSVAGPTAVRSGWVRRGRPVRGLDVAGTRGGKALVLGPKTQQFAKPRATPWGTGKTHCRLPAQRANRSSGEALALEIGPGQSLRSGGPGLCARGHASGSPAQGPGGWRSLKSRHEAPCGGTFRSYGGAQAERNVWENRENDDQQARGARARAAG